MNSPSITRVLVVEDESDFRSLLSDAFESNQCEVAVAESATRGMVLFKEKKPQIVLSDVRFPTGPSGFDLLKAIRKLNIDEPKVGLMTGFTDIPITEMYSEGACAVFSKPLQLQQIVTAMLQKIRPLPLQWSVKAAPPHSPKVSKILDSLDKAETAGEFRLGKGGFFLQTPQVSLEKGAWVEFSIKFSSGATVSALEGDGIIRWTRRAASAQFKPGYGIEILHLSDSCRNNVLEFLPQIKGPAFIPLA